MNPVQFSIPLEHPCLPGHFPRQPVVPGVVILDAVQSAIEHEAGALAATRWPQVKFLQPLLPGQQARIEFHGHGSIEALAVAASPKDEGDWRA